MPGPQLTPDQIAAEEAFLAEASTPIAQQVPPTMGPPEAVPVTGRSIMETTMAVQNEEDRLVDELAAQAAGGPVTAGMGRSFVVDKQGELQHVPDEQLDLALQRGFRLATQQEVGKMRETERIKDQPWEESVFQHTKTLTNAALGGLPEAIEGSTGGWSGQEANRQSQAFREQHPIASGVEEFGGAVASIPLTGGFTAPKLVLSALYKSGMKAASSTLPTIVENTLLRGAESMTLARATSETAFNVGTKAFRNVNDRIAVGDPQTYESVTSGLGTTAVISFGLGAALGKWETVGEKGVRVGWGTSGAKKVDEGISLRDPFTTPPQSVLQGNGPVSWVDRIGGSPTDAVDDVFIDVPNEAAMRAAGWRAGEAVKSAAEKTVTGAVAGAARGVDDVVEAGVRAGERAVEAGSRATDDILDPFIKAVQEDNVVAQWARNATANVDVIEKTAGDFATPMRQGVDDLERATADVVQNEATKVVVDTTTLQKSVDHISGIDRTFDDLVKRYPGFADDAVREEAKKVVTNALKDTLELNPRATFDDALRALESTNIPVAGANAIARVSSELHALAERPMSELTQAALQGIRKNLMNDVPEGVRGLEALNLSNMRVAMLNADKSLNGLITPNAMSLTGAKNMLLDARPTANKNFVEYMSLRARALKAFGREVPDTANQAMTSKAIVAYEQKLVREASSMKNPVGDAMSKYVTGVGANIGSGAGYATGIPGASMVGRFVGGKVEEAVKGYLNPLIANAVRSQEVRDALVKNVKKASEFGLSTIKPVLQAASAETRTPAWQRRYSQKDADEAMGTLAQTMDQSTARGAYHAVTLSVLRGTGDERAAQQLENFTLEASKRISEKKAELIYEDAGDNPISHLLKGPNDEYEKQRFYDYTRGVTDPSTVIERLSSGLASPDEVAGLRDVHPLTYQAVCDDIKNSLAELKTLPDPNTLAYLESRLDTQFVPSDLSQAQQRFIAINAGKQEQSQGFQVQNGVAPNESSRTGYTSMPRQ